MTPAQQTALEAVVGRALGVPELEQIEPYIADPDNRNDVEIAALLSVGRTRTQSQRIGVGTVLATLGAGGGAFLDALVQVGQLNRNVYWAMELIRASNFDIGMPATRAQMQTLATAVPAVAGGIAALLELGLVPDPLPVSAISHALNIAEGRMTL